MNKKAITSAKLVGICLGLLALIIVAWIFIPPAYDKTVKIVKSLEQKAGLLTPEGQSLEKINNYVAILVSDNPMPEIKNIIKLNPSWNWLDAGSEVAYDALSDTDKITRFYTTAKESLQVYYRELKVDEQETMSIEYEKTKEDMDKAAEYALARQQYNLLKAPANKGEAQENLNALMSIRTTIASVNKTTPIAYKSHKSADLFLKELSDPLNCVLSKAVCENKLRFYCRWQASKNLCVYACDRLGEWDCMKRESGADCFVVYNYLLETGQRTSFKECKDCAQADCSDYKDEYWTCLKIIKSCGKCQTTEYECHD